MKILILGSSGQIGSFAVPYLRNKGHEVFEWDIFNDPKQDLREYNINLYNLMSCCDFVYFLACDVGGAKYLSKYQNSYNFIMNNLNIMKYTFECLKETKKPFLFTSSQMSDMQQSTYGIMKSLGEKLTNELGGLVVRLWNVYGKENGSEKSHVITDFIDMSIKGKKIVMRTNGKESRQFLYVEDCVDCFLTLSLLYDTLDRSKNYHISSFKWNTILDIAKIISEISGSEIIPGKMTDDVQLNSMNSPDEFILNFWKPKTSIENGIEKIYMYTKDQKHYPTIIR